MMTMTMTMMVVMINHDINQEMEDEKSFKDKQLKSAEATMRRLGVRAYRTPPEFYPYRSRRAEDENLQRHRAKRGVVAHRYLPL